MRADRLLSLLILLQSRGRLTARELAEELEVSVRTIYRDIEALSMAGVPVYAERGRGGGCALLESYRTNLTGLSSDEIQALFAMSLPSPLAELGLSQDFKAAMLKLSAALPSTRQEERIRQRIHLDWSDWAAATEPVPHLRPLYRAICEDRLVQVTIRPLYGTEISRCLAPYGLVAKASVWYVVGAVNDRPRVYRVSQLVDVLVTDDHFCRPETFDLGHFWRTHCALISGNLPRYPVTVRVSPALIADLPRYFGEHARQMIAEAQPPAADGWQQMTMVFSSFTEARERLLGFGRAVEVLAPEPLRLSIIDFAEQIMAFYQSDQGEMA